VGSRLPPDPHPPSLARSAAAQVRSLLTQIELCVGANRAAAAPVALALTGWTGRVADAWAAAGGPQWRAARHAEGTLAAFPGARVIVLSPDAEAPLEAPLDAGAVYVIGGLVDRSVVRHATRGFAAAHGIAAARLPFAEHAEALGLAAGTCRRPVLNVDAALRALLGVHASGGDWAPALAAALPPRKLKPRLARTPVDGGGSGGGGSGCSSADQSGLLSREPSCDGGGGRPPPCN
jgi:hypothetical protein